MEEKNLTDEEIVRILEECFFGDTRKCCECKLLNGKGLASCMKNVARPTLDIIRRLQGENERLTQEANQDTVTHIDLCTENLSLRKQIAELQKQVDELKAYAEDIYKKAIDREEDAYSLWFDKGKEQAVKDTAKEIYQMADEIATGSQNDGANILSYIKERYGVEVE